MLGRRKRSYLEYFQKNAAGEYIYFGSYYRYDNPEKPRKREFLKLWVLCLVTLAAELVIGFFPIPGLSRSFYVLIPYVAAIIFAFSMVWSLGQMTAAGDPMREYDYESSVKKLPRRSLITAVCSALSMVGEGIFLLRNGTNGHLGHVILFFLLALLAGIVSLLEYRVASGLLWSKFRGNED